MGMGLELAELKKQVQEAHIKTYKAWSMLCRVIKHPSHPHRQRVYQEYLDAVREEVDVAERYAKETGLIPEQHLPFELYYLYYEGTPQEQHWKKICSEYTERIRNAKDTENS